MFPNKRVRTTYPVAVGLYMESVKGFRMAYLAGTYKSDPGCWIQNGDSESRFHDQKVSKSVPSTDFKNNHTAFIISESK